ncbi:MAG TPA: hypothetical protein VFT99_20250, partial [Roseiflexaceae bacterium]|nr:hypothetical protein [Roseiflexaceae bacterium]
MAVDNTRTLHTGSEAGRVSSRLRQQRVRRALAYIVLTVLGLLFTVPFVWLLSTSLKPASQLFKLPPEWIPNPFTWSNYAKATTLIPFWLYLKNTLYIALFNVVASVASCSLVAYGFARIKWPGRDALFLVLVS